MSTQKLHVDALSGICIHQATPCIQVESLVRATIACPKADRCTIFSTLLENINAVVCSIILDHKR
jgi:hypothetical protein